MWTLNWRDQAWSQLDQPWDIIIIGGGITGAGILYEAASRGLKTLLVEQHDFASGTSSRSSKLVHGGFRYLKNGQVRLTMESVRERERLLREARGLVTPLGFLLANFKGDAIPAWVFNAGLVAYDLLALQWGHRHYDAYDVHDLCPPLRQEGLAGGFRYFDAQTDDARLVLRVVQEGVSAGGLALNYTRAAGLLRGRDGQVCGVMLQDLAPDGAGRSAEVQARTVINAAGAWADELRSDLGAAPRLRRLRGSHLVLPASRLPLSRAVSLLHPRDGRPVFAFPWEGVALVGTTDVDMEGPLPADPCSSAAEVEYLMQALQYAFPAQALDYADIQSTYAGVRPVLNTGKADPSKESREHILWNENGLLTVTGGKLTTYRLMAQQALGAIDHRMRNGRQAANDTQFARTSPLDPAELPAAVSPALRLRLAGRHGAETAALLAAARPTELEPAANTPVLWAELRWAARAEAVVHLDDLLLRRARLGLLLPRGGLDCLEAIRQVVQPELGWSDERWGIEARGYADLWKRCYHCPPQNS